MEEFFFKRFKEYGLPVLTEPCELLDLIEVIPKNRVPLYQLFAIDMTQIHWNPNKNHKVAPNTKEPMQLFNLFNVFDTLIRIYRKHIEKHLLPHGLSEHLNHAEKSIPSNVSGLLENLRETLSDQISLINEVGWGLVDSRILELVPMMNSTVDLLKDVERKVTGLPIVHVIFDEFVKKQTKLFEIGKDASGSGLLNWTKFDELASYIETKFKENSTYTPKFNPLREEFEKDKEKKACRTFCSKIVEVLNVPG